MVKANPLQGFDSRFESGRELGASQVGHKALSASVCGFDTDWSTLL